MEAAAATQQAERPFADEMQLLLRAQVGDQACLPELRRLLDDRPELWRQFGDLARHVRDALLALASGKSLLARESISRRLDELQAELAGPSPSPLEKLLVERLVLCWAQGYLADLDAMQKAGTPQAAHAQQRANSAQHRYLAAIKQLALVRKLLKPAPSTLDLLRFPVDETSGTKGSSHPRSRPPTATAASCG
jgi:hypothetical protein